MTPKGHMVIRCHCDLLYDLKDQYDHLLSDWPSLWPQTNKCPKTELTGEMFCYKKINTFMKKAKEEWIHDIVYDPKRSHGH